MRTKPSFEVVDWKTIRQDVIRVNPKLTQIIDNLNPNDHFPLYKVHYPFGSKILDHGKFCLPNFNMKLPPLPLNHYPSPSFLKEQLAYRALPMGVVLTKSVELGFETPQRIIPIRIFSEGQLLGVQEALDPKFSSFSHCHWSMTAGARSLFMLPKISEALGHKRLRREFNLRLPTPKSLTQQWHIFKEIANHPHFPTQWACEILLFSYKWIEQLQSNTSWQPLREYCYQEVLNKSIYWRYITLLNFLWQEFAAELKYKNIRCGSHQLETLKHLVTAGSGTLPLFKSASLSDEAGPIQTLQSIYIDLYGLNYYPTMMCPHHFSANNPESIAYYSLSEPTLVESGSTRDITNMMQLTREIKELFEHLITKKDDNESKTRNSTIHHLTQKLKVDFYHSDADSTGQLLQSKSLPAEDPALIKTLNQHKKLPFCDSSPFLKGCIRFKTKNSHELFS